jgi:hypothetical protein
MANFNTKKGTKAINPICEGQNPLPTGNIDHIRLIMVIINVKDDVDNLHSLVNKTQSDDEVDITPTTSASSTHSSTDSIFQSVPLSSVDIGDRSYLYVVLKSPSLVNWYQAVTLCDHYDQHGAEGSFSLPVPKNQAEHDFVASLNDHAWLGITDDNHEGNFTDYKTGEYLCFSAWQSGDPDGGINENHVSLFPDISTPSLVFWIDNYGKDIWTDIIPCFKQIKGPKTCT